MAWCPAFHESAQRALAEATRRDALVLEAAALVLERWWSWTEGTSGMPHRLRELAEEVRRYNVGVVCGFGFDDGRELPPYPTCGLAANHDGPHAEVNPPPVEARRSCGCGRCVAFYLMGDRMPPPGTMPRTRLPVA